MTYDPAWDMPRFNWQQQGSFEIPEIPPAYEPDAEPLVCLPPINRYWLPYVMGALDQLRNPSSWIVVDDDAMYNTLARVTKLREMLGVGVTCFMYQLRLQDCVLQESTDGGTTWSTVEGWAYGPGTCVSPQTQLQLTEGCDLQESFDGGTSWETVPGWAEHFGPCVQDNTPIIGLPPNPGDQSPDQLACSIAAYLADQIILDSMGAAVTAIQDDLTLLAMADSILTIIPEFILVRAFVDGVSIVYTAVQEGTLSDYEAAIADGTLWNLVTCAIYAAIVGDGYVTPGNFAAIVANIGGISYAHSHVIDAIVAFVESLGATGLAQLSQRAGLETGADCTCGSGPWCTWWQAGELDMCNGDSTALMPFGSIAAATCSSSAWTAALSSDGTSYWTDIQFILPSSRTITSARVDYDSFGHDDYLFTYMYDAAGTLLFTTSVRNWNSGIGPGPISNVKRIEFICGMGGPTFFHLSSVKIGGPDNGSPWGVDNGVCG